MEEGKSKAVLSRRKALTRLGLAAAVVYAAPTITHIEAEAKRRRRARPSHICPGGSCSGGKGKGGKSKGGGKSKSKSRSKSRGKGKR
ncbi:MAG: hypothetical protein HOK30_07990 [Rhodospirillaceae bacterium]|jgi:hypothetical protein|nr:hypothetical protein [Rhodospirillaceae bacterium]MBT5194357.1 hypothetical protein [Rhodospirillaceae bacterium]MBT5897096.1 hypothetical protein [Rhodospirillaceae bacterium]MBT6427586.1 hypothetical protein [Rhodospirillaceae bacterium]